NEMPEYYFWMVEDRDCRTGGKPYYLVISYRLLVIHSKQLSLMRHNLRNKRFPLWICFDKASNSCHRYVLRHRDKTSNFWSVQVQYCFGVERRIYIAGDAHFWKAHDIDTLIHPCL